VTVVLIILQYISISGISLIGFLQYFVEAFDEGGEGEEGGPVILEDWHSDFPGVEADVEVVDLVEELEGGGVLRVGFGEAEQ
jgi:hypothetical protein